MPKAFPSKQAQNMIIMIGIYRFINIKSNIYIFPGQLV